jgi:RNA-binding protein NOB1
MSWVGPPSASRGKDNDPTVVQVYRALVVDSGPIIRQTGLTSLRGRALTYYTVPAVLAEIRDAKARTHLQQLPFELVPREPSAEGIAAVVEFARQTGDYQSLSTVDLQVLGLLYDLEREGCGGVHNMAHVRTTPKRKVGVGKIQSLNPTTTVSAAASDANNNNNNNPASDEEETKHEDPLMMRDGHGASFFESHEIDIVDDSEDDDDNDDEDSEDEENPAHEEMVEDNDEASQGGHEDDTPKEVTSTVAPFAAPKSWAMLVNPGAASRQTVPVLAAASTPVAPIAEQAMSVSFGQMNLSDNTNTGGEVQDDGARNHDDNLDVQAELQSEFPSLQAALTVPYDGSDDEGDQLATTCTVSVGRAGEVQEKIKQEALKPVSSSGKMYNSFRKYGDLMKPKTPAPKSKGVTNEEAVSQSTVPSTPTPMEDSSNANQKRVQSRIMGGTALSGQADEVEDDGEGWITCSRDIQTMKSSGVLDPQRGPNDKSPMTKELAGPPISVRTACTTTDFAMQNVILQMNLELLSVDGIKIRRLKSWVTRCGACYKIYPDGGGEGPQGAGMKRLFCSHCGSDYMQRIAASVDSKTGRLRLHMSKRYKNNLRGTKFSLPKPGSVRIS